jgi:ABC-type multidrug transport system fused ATPase/permease subunit
MKLKDERTKMTNEVLNGIKVIKLYAWETPMMETIERIRRDELKCIRNAGLINGCVDVFNSACPFLVAVISFASYSMLGGPDGNNVLTPQVAFIALTLFNQLRSPMTMLGFLINQIVQAIVSNKRLKDFLVADEINPHSVDWVADGSCEEAITACGASLAWDSSAEGEPTKGQPPPTLQNLNVEITRGSLVAIVGKVGTGKSSLLSGLLGEMEKLGGSIAVRGRCAYTPQVGLNNIKYIPILPHSLIQTAWIQNLSLRDNVTFGKPFESRLYERVLDACALKADIVLDKQIINRQA